MSFMESFGMLGSLLNADWPTRISCLSDITLLLKLRGLFGQDSPTPTLHFPSTATAFLDSVVLALHCTFPKLPCPFGRIWPNLALHFSKIAIPCFGLIWPTAKT